MALNIAVIIDKHLTSTLVDAIIFILNSTKNIDIFGRLLVIWAESELIPF